MVARGGCLLAVLVLAGCTPTPTAPAGTGAREASRDFYAALVRQDWEGAYRLLHADSRARCGREQFTQLAQGYRRGLGLEPEEVRVWACEEQGDRAIAHVAITGLSQSRRREYKDAVTLRRDGQGWGVVLPPGFGQSR